MNDDFYERLAATIRGRRSSLHVDRDTPVPVALIAELCELAQWAPNHKRTWPCRFAAFVGDGRARLGQAFVTDVLANNPQPNEASLTKTATKYLRTPAILVVGSAAHDNPEYHDENRDAVAASIQTLLLAATAKGLASFWSSPPTRPSPTVLELCGFDSDVQVIGVIYLGWPNHDPVAVPPRPTASLTIVE